MERLRFSWRTFWARRSRARIASMCVLLALTVLLIVWFVLPQDWQRQTQDSVALVALWVGSLDTRTLLVALIGLCVVEALVLLFVPSYRKYPYLTTAPALIPLVTVYLDGENQHPEHAIKPFMRFLQRRLNGRRADLLYFHRATQTAGTAAYKKLRLSGFQPVDVPHNPTGKSVMLEALDRELAMHAFERALLGPDKQLFIIISRDGDFAPLIYRLVALGHRVEIWASGPSEAYGEVQKYLNTAQDDGLPPLVEVIDLARHIPEFRTQTALKTAVPRQSHPLPKSTVRTKSSNLALHHKPLQPSTRNGSPRAKKYNIKQTLLIPSAITASGEERIYRAIMRTADVHSAILERMPLAADEKRNMQFRGVLGMRSKYLLAKLGYGDGIGTSLRYWLMHLSAVHVFKMTNENSFPVRDEADPVEATQRMFAMMRLVANAALALASATVDGVVRMHEIANKLASPRFDDSEPASPLLLLIMPGNDKRTTHTRYFVHSARALGLLMFEDVPGRPDEVSHPRLSDTAHEVDTGEDASPISGMPPASE